ncbi:hypothetical protein CNMCM6936_009368 [Aspergillus lentulus]|uniref:Helicase C-terminal domain-containing protein n=1 Tax=Aspergillus lentulus TaxID=293939 RepID=A0AAN5YJC9_ASPLE|nr:hypothetical protein CNMCM6936_009368 [Aspergillus lentulus]KAF4173663.1 hypothetical protein CNMCM8060_009626 [Aspergillus lentulus]KAF4182900.1 hypothetical protein CNMCM7927_009442 [Aspergillus lentulus]KAF4192760.1 hypothetical protein CNMCM8694_000021 [Aspergillus lentulus]KAF4202435.1 hypothetical protein CNMCM8927_000189 [Aspergillus lentulus]
MGEAGRREAAAEFADTRSSCRILLTSYQCGAHGLNLHAECSCVILLEPSLNLNTLFQAVGRVQARRCALPQFSAQLHDLLKSMVMAAQAKDDGEDEEAADEAEAEVIQRAVLDLDGMNARMKPRGRKRERARQDSPTEGRARRKVHQGYGQQVNIGKCFGSGRKASDYELHRGAEVQPSAVMKQRADQSRNSALLHYEETEEPATTLTSHVEWNDIGKERNRMSSSDSHHWRKQVATPTLSSVLPYDFWVSSQGGKKAKGKPQKNVATSTVFHNPINPHDGRGP